MKRNEKCLNGFHIAALLFILMSVPLLSAHSQNTRIDNAQALDKICKTMVIKHEPDRGVEYVPGIDIHGKSVLPADLNATTSALDIGEQIYPIVIPLELEMLDRYNLDLPAGIKADAMIAGITIHQNGRVTLNGHDISGNISSYCIEYNDRQARSTDNTRSSSSAQPQPEHAPLSPRYEDGEALDGQFQ